MTHEVSVRALVLRRRDLGENDRSLILLTPELGKIEVTARGARKPGSRLASASEPLAFLYAQLALGRKRRYLTQVRPLGSFSSMRRDYDRLQTAIAFCELAGAVFPWEQSDPEIFDLFVGLLEALRDHPMPLVALVWAELRLMEAIGFAPRFDECVQTGRPPRTAKVWVSTSAGGYLDPEVACEAGDRFGVSYEALVGLARTAELVEPPPRLAFAEECLTVLHRFWLHIADMRLPAHEALQHEFATAAVTR